MSDRPVRTRGIAASIRRLRTARPSERREWLFALMSRNAQRATAYFGIPVNRVVELGQEVEI